MKGHKEVIKALNDILTGELTAINQYFLHARMLQDWGLFQLGKIEYEASIDEMKHADELIKRILFLEGLPNVQKLHPIKIGQNVEEIIESDLAVEFDALKKLKKYIKVCEEKSDYTTRDIFQRILISEEEHVDWLETQKSLIEKAGLQNYIQAQISMNDTAPQ